ncbi:MAG: thiamine-phosphate kinase [Gordonia sp. (in: high G+C Gram-positive bacteria)]
MSSENQSDVAGVTVGDVGERAVIALLTRAAGRARGSGTSAAPEPGGDIVIGSGDDAAVIDVGPTVISADTAVQDRHFRLDWSTPHQIGARAVVASAADIAAMGGRTVGVLAAIACPQHTPVTLLTGLNAGIVDAAHGLSARVLGGDLVAADQILVTITAVGTLSGVEPVTLSGARPGDVLAVSGGLGAAAAGLAVLDAYGPAALGDWRRSEDPRAAVVGGFQVPAPDLAQGPIAARAGAHAMTDISDGLVEELRTLAQSSGVLLDVTASAVPRLPELGATAALLDADEREWVLTGGEDHHLLAAFAPGDVPPGWSSIGSVAAGGPGVRIDGAPLSRLRGWQSFG